MSSITVDIQFYHEDESVKFDEIGCGQSFSCSFVEVHNLRTKWIENVLIFLELTRAAALTELESESAHLVDEEISARHLRTVHPTAGYRALVAPANPFGGTQVGWE